MRTTTLVALWTLGCGGGGGTNVEPKDAPAAAPSQAVDLAAHAEAFVETPGSRSRASVDWSSVVRARTLATVQATRAMDVEERKALGGGTDPLDSMLAKLSRLDLEAVASRQAEAFAASWAGALDCRAQPATESLLVDVPAQTLAELPAAYGETVKTVRTGKAFEVLCQDLRAVVVLDAKGRVVALEGPRKQSEPVELRAGNPFSDSVGEPDE